MRRVTILLSVFVIYTISFALGPKGNRVSNNSQEQAAQQPAGIIDGSANPENISDYLTYSTLFRFISNRSGLEKSGIRAYLKGIGMSRRCEGCPQAATNEESQIDALMVAAEEFYARAYPLDVEIGELVKQHRNPGQEIKDQLAHLRQQKETICAEIVASLKWRLGPTDAQKVQEHVGRMKRNMKVVLNTH